ncbi:DUF5710 domain-containing protein [Actinopolymorpha rutila]|uniref:DUF5710 domain-containing protein n=1 Tax=Actinopolymorpha rutila TaxID=446787 RepID=A0A852ZLE6_9ACTN|nr:DUF5710 domain-containing protein [Actinopolymorpha rutila]NYH92945.1 hypothetical protein [Actinopolymorpha rutila]
MWLDVPFAEKEAAKKAGARWDPDEMRWWVTSSKAEHVQKWLPADPLPETFPGEDRQFGEGLFVDLVPQSSWFTNARTCIAQTDWQRVRRVVIFRAGKRCEVCQRRAEPAVRLWLEVHERWAYDDAERVQALRRLICLCSACHLSTHYGFARVTGREEEAREHLAKIRREQGLELASHVGAAMDLWQMRSRYSWALDLRILTEAGVELRTPPPGTKIYRPKPPVTPKPAERPARRRLWQRLLGSA